MTDRHGDDGAAETLYRERFPEEEPDRRAWRRAVWQVLVDGFFARWIPPEASILDFGCGLGEFINAVSAKRRIGADSRSAARGHLEAGVEFELTQGARVPSIDTSSLDVVFCSNLLEHLPDRETVTALLQEFHRVLAPDGKLLILGPNLRYTGAAYWDFFDHVIPLTHVSLGEALATGGFETERMIARFLPYTSVGARMTPPSLVRWYLRLPPLWRVMGAQFFAVARPRR
jgi:SAM-dependent methyltransferase